MTLRKRELTRTLTIRLPEPILVRLRRLAAKNRRKLSDYVRLTLEEVDRRGGMPFDLGDEGKPEPRDE